MTDTELLTRFEDEAFGCALISDDQGWWAVASSGFQNLPDPPGDVETHFFIEAKYWRKSVREALEAYFNDEVKAPSGDEFLAEQAEEV